MAEARQHEDAVDPREPLLRRSPVDELLGVDPVELHLQAVGAAGVGQGLHDGEVGVLELYVLADDRDPYRPTRLQHAGDEVPPLPEVGVGRAQAQLIQHQIVEAFLVQIQGDRVQVRGVLGRDNGVELRVRKQRDLLPYVVVYGPVRAANEHVGAYADLAQALRGVLGRLGLELAGGLDVGYVGDVDVEHVTPPHVVSELPYGFQERQALDVAYGAPDLGYDDVLVLAEAPDPVLDLVGYVRDDLHGRPQVVAPPLAGYDLPVDATRGHVGEPAQVLVEKALVVTEVQVRLRPVLGDEDLAVLVRVHRPRVHVDVRVELLEHDPVAPALEQHPQRRSTRPLAYGRNHAARHEDILGLAHLHPRRKYQRNTPTFTASRKRGRESGGAREHRFPQTSTPAHLHGSLSYDFWRQN